MKAATAEQAAFIKSPEGTFYRVDAFDPDEGVMHFHDEDYGDEHASALNELEGWTAYKLQVITE